MGSTTCASVPTTRILLLKDATGNNLHVDDNAYRKFLSLGDIATRPIETLLDGCGNGWEKQIEESLVW